MASPKRIVLVCEGNTCRSIMAEATLNKALNEELGGSSRQIIITSAGMSANAGDPASANAIAAMKELDLDISSHRARPLAHDLLSAADLVLTMTASQKRTVLLRYPSLEGRVMTFTEFAGLADELGFDISDPFGYDMEVYRQCAKDVDKASRSVAKRLGRNTPGPNPPDVEGPCGEGQKHSS